MAHYTMDDYLDTLRSYGTSNYKEIPVSQFTKEAIERINENSRLREIFHSDASNEQKIICTFNMRPSSPEKYRQGPEFWGYVILANKGLKMVFSQSAPLELKMIWAYDLE